MHKLYMNWLQDAYGMERSVLNMLQSQAKTADAYPRIKKQIEKHIQETQRHAALDRLRRGLELDEDALIIPFSSLTGEGIRPLWEVIEEVINAK